MPSGAGNFGQSSEPWRRLHLVQRLRPAGIADLARIAAEIIEPERHAGHARFIRKLTGPGD